MPYISNPPGSQDRVTELNDVTITSIASNEVLKWNGSAWINQTLSEANVLTVAGPTFTGVLTVGSAVISEADLEQIDDLTAGTAVASKALVVDSNKDIGTIRNLTIDGIFRIRYGCFWYSYNRVISSSGCKYHGYFGGHNLR